MCQYNEHDERLKKPFGRIELRQTQQEETNRNLGEWECYEDLDLRINCLCFSFHHCFGSRPVPNQGSHISYIRYKSQDAGLVYVGLNHLQLPLSQSPFLWLRQTGRETSQHGLFHLSKEYMTKPT